MPLVYLHGSGKCPVIFLRSHEIGQFIEAHTGVPFLHSEQRRGVPGLLHKIVKHDVVPVLLFLDRAKATGII